MNSRHTDRRDEGQFNTNITVLYYQIQYYILSYRPTQGCQWLRKSEFCSKFGAITRIAPNLMFLRKKIGADVADVNIKLQIIVINRHIISYIMDRCDTCEYKATNESNQQTHNFIHYGWM